MDAMIFLFIVPPHMPTKTYHGLVRIFTTNTHSGFCTFLVSPLAYHLLKRLCASMTLLCRLFLLNFLVQADLHSSLEQ